MHYIHEESGTSFDVADRMTVREQLAFRSRLGETAGESGIVRYWLVGQSVLTNWQSELIPDPAVLDLDATDDRRVADAVAWTANTIAVHILNLEIPAKNS